MAKTNLIERRAKRVVSFEDAVLTVAMNASRNDPGSQEFFKKIMGALLPKVSSVSPIKVELECNLQQTTGDVVEAALRSKFGDRKEDRKKDKKKVDVVFGGIDIEVKYKREGFKGLATDSQSLRKRDDKWYIYAKGDIAIGCKSGYDIWVMRADHFYDAMEKDRTIDATKIIKIPAKPTPQEKLDAITLIYNEIEKIQSQLANAIWNKAVDKDFREDVTDMGLDKRVNLNRVRFDIKFESLIRAYVRETLRG